VALCELTVDTRELVGLQMRFPQLVDQEAA
jgi:hypothetical protein